MPGCFSLSTGITAGTSVLGSGALAIAGSTEAGTVACTSVARSSGAPGLAVSGDADAIGCNREYSSGIDCRGRGS